MRRAEGNPENGSRAAVAPLLVVTAILLLVPLVSMQGPMHTTPFDAFNVVFMGVYWCYLLTRRESVSFPFAVPIWLIFLGSCVGMYSAVEPARSLSVIIKEIYLYFWFITTLHFLGRYCAAATVAAIWVSIASVLGFLMVVDGHSGLFGGQFGGEVRGAGTFENPNMCGSYLVMSFFLAWSAARGGRRHFYVLMPLFVAAILETASNGALMSLTVGTVIAALVRPGGPLLQRVGVVLVAVALTCGLLGGVDERTWNASLAMMSRGRGQIGGAAVEGASDRFPLWLDIAHEVQRVPTGVGPGNFNRQGGAVSGDTHGPHNEYLGMLVERGPFGLIGWCAFLVSSTLVLKRLHGVTIPGSSGLATEPLYGALAAISMHAVVMEVFHFRHLWMLLVLICAALVQAGPVASRLSMTAAPSRRVLSEAI